MFHIGAYITLSTLLVAILGLEGFRQRVTTIKRFLIVTLLFFLTAGACGGVVASNIPYFGSFEKLDNTNIGPFFAVHAWSMRTWASLEHVAFWVGIISAVAGVIVASCRKENGVFSPAEIAEHCRKLAQECLGVAARAKTEHRSKMRNIAEGLFELADEADAKGVASGDRVGSKPADGSG